jgi:hypothetical protein
VCVRVAHARVCRVSVSVSVSVFVSVRVARARVRLSARVCVHRQAWLVLCLSVCMRAPIALHAFVGPFAAFLTCLSTSFFVCVRACVRACMPVACRG